MNNSKRHNREARGTPARHRLYADVFTALLAIGATAPVCAQRSDAPQEYSIQASSLGDALNQLATQSKLQIVYSPDLVKGKTVSGLSGRHTWRAALQQLLRGTGLEWGLVNSSTVVIKKASTKPTEGANSKPRAESVAQKEEVTNMPAIVVTGTHIRGMEKIAAPSILVTRREIENAGYSELDDIFEDLPQNFGEIGADVQSDNGTRGYRDNLTSRASGIDLRGLGAGSTLTVLNGVRRAGSGSGQIVDISAIPLSMIERVEIVTGGRSAIYGSDAVAGVVNLVTRSSFRGGEVQASYGWGERGGEKIRMSAIGGAESDSAEFVAAYDYARNQELDLAHTELIRSVGSSGQVQNRFEIQPDVQRQSVLFSGKFFPSEKVDLHADAIYTIRNNSTSNSYIFPGESSESYSSNDIDSEQYSVALDGRMAIGDRWSLKAAGTYSVVDERYNSNSRTIWGAFNTESEGLIDSKVTVTGMTVVADGDLFSINDAIAKGAIGAEARSEDFEESRMSWSNGTPTPPDLVSEDRKIRSVFAELVVPIVENGANLGLRGFEISAAARYDHYSDFGDTFNPQFGVIWQPAKSLSLRAAASTAFKAPGLHERNAQTYFSIGSYRDPANGGESPVLVWHGVAPTLGPEEATTWSAGIDFRPESFPNALISLSYYDIEYENRISLPAVTAVSEELVLEREQDYLTLINRGPTADEISLMFVEDDLGRIINSTNVNFDTTAMDGSMLLNIFPSLVVFDNRLSNISNEKVRGVDFGMSFRRSLGAGELSFGLNGTYTIRHDRSVTPSSPDVSAFNEVFRPVDLRARANVGWEKNAYSAFLYANYTDNYSNPLTTPVSEVDSWTTADLTIRFNGDKSRRSDVFGGFNLTLNINNIFDKRPPFVAGSRFLPLYDSTNANPIGRYMTLQLMKRW